MSTPVAQVLCPVCRTPVPDKDYYTHALKHQQEAKK